MEQLAISKLDLMVLEAYVNELAVLQATALPQALPRLPCREHDLSALLTHRILRQVTI